MAENLPAKEGTLFTMLQDPALKRQMQLAIPKHMTVDRLLRVAMTAIRVKPKLMECSPKSIMACIMGCAQLGLEPEPFLGQAYLVPFKDKFGRLHAQLIPGYRGYISLARRSGEVQSVSAQVVYTKDNFRLQYGLSEVLEHVPADGDRGEIKGAYVVFRYKDGSHSFDYMSKGDIDRIRERSKSKDDGPWVTDYDEMAKKTVIRRHIKLAPLSIEMAKAAALEERAIIGEDQVGMIFDTEGETIDAELSSATPPGIAHQQDPEAEFLRLATASGITTMEDLAGLALFVTACAKDAKQTEEWVKKTAAKDWPRFIKLFEKNHPKKREREEIAQAMAKAKKAGKGKDQGENAQPEPPQEAQGPENVNTTTGEVLDGMLSLEVACPNREGEGVLRETCVKCQMREGCPAL